MNKILSQRKSTSSNPFKFYISMGEYEKFEQLRMRNDNLLTLRFV